MKAGSPVWVTLEPVGRRVCLPAGSTLLEAAQAGGVELAAVCGGIGHCRGCAIRPVHGPVSAVTLEEEAQFTAGELALGLRLACQTEVLGDVVVDVPPESLTAPQRLLLEGEGGPVALDPVVTAADVVLAPAELTDLRADARRLLDALPEATSIEPAVLRYLPEMLRTHDWRVRAAVRSGRVVAVLPLGTRLFGLAVDVGTTSLAAYLLDLETGERCAKAGAMNPQIAYGEDVISRIVYCAEHEDGRALLQVRLIDTLNGLVGRLCSEAGCVPEQIVEAVLAGNTVMHHLALGLPVAALGEAPYVAAIDDSLELPAADLGLRLAEGAQIWLPPNIAGYVGADHVAALVATGMVERQDTTLVVDIGTNTEMTLAHSGRRWSCSCASGPAFEGAHIRYGMRAAPGAIERVQVVDGVVHVQTIGHGEPVGVCGSGILDAVAEMARVVALDRRGALVRTHPLVHDGAFALAGPVTVSRADVAEIQLAKAAIRAGIDLLLAEAGIAEAAIESFVIAGAFGAYIQVPSALRVGMFPPLPLERFRQVGNAAGIGACQLVLSRHAREQAEQLARGSTYVELTIHEGFRAAYMARMGLEQGESV